MEKKGKEMESKLCKGKVLYIQIKSEYKGAEKPGKIKKSNWKGEKETCQAWE
jgi:hypothetical protein